MYLTSKTQSSRFLLSTKRNACSGSNGRIKTKLCPHLFQGKITPGLNEAQKTFKNRYQPFDFYVAIFEKKNAVNKNGQFITKK